jgi:hypothetical protein
VTHVSNFEWMETSVYPANAFASDVIFGWHNYGVGWTPLDVPPNAHDLRMIWRPGDDVRVDVDCFAFHNAQFQGRSLHIFSLEVYTEANWVQQGNPDYRAFWQIQFNPGPPQQAQNTLTVTIPAWHCQIEPEWCVYYTCEAVDLDQAGPPPWFDIACQNYWIVLW